MSDIDQKLLGGLTMLVVDESADIRSQLDAALTLFGAHTITARNGYDGVAELRRHRIDVIICDISMPIFSGHNFLRALRALSCDATYPVPAIALTAVDEPAQRRRALQGGFHAYWLKPFSVTALVREIARLAGRLDGGQVRAA